MMSQATTHACQCHCCSSRQQNTQAASQRTCTYQKKVRGSVAVQVRRLKWRGKERTAYGQAGHRVDDEAGHDAARVLEPIHGGRHLRCDVHKSVGIEVAQHHLTGGVGCYRRHRNPCPRWNAAPSGQEQCDIVAVHASYHVNGGEGKEQDWKRVDSTDTTYTPSTLSTYTCGCNLKTTSLRL